ncbi:MAG: hypothetical protein PHW58_02630 [Candidatus Methanofastidiosa archaeon]|jgi:hypothetical protein|nr:hypothetical protein [Candidatus Methanofastidiosa archaeon]
MDPLAIISQVLAIMFSVAETVASEISAASEGIVPPEAVGVFSIVILLVLLRLGFDFTKKVVDILLVIFVIYLALAIIPNVV